MNNLRQDPRFRCDVFFDGVTHRGLEYPYDQATFPELAQGELEARPLESFYWDTRVKLIIGSGELRVLGGGAYANGAMGLLASFCGEELIWSIATDGANPVSAISVDDEGAIIATTTSGHRWQISGRNPAKLTYLTRRTIPIHQPKEK